MSPSRKTTSQEKFWKGNFGDNYISRNNHDTFLSSKISLFAKILNETSNVKSVIEYGPNIGFNIRAIQQLLPSAKFTSVEINKKACTDLLQIKNNHVENCSILDFRSKKLFDLSLVMTLLIHINPKKLNQVYETLYKNTKKYICIVEYYNPTPVEVIYRGHKGKLFKRDFAGEMLDKYRNLKLINYGFVYKRDKNFPYDDINWFLLEKKK